MSHQLDSRPHLIRYEILHNVERVAQPEGDAQFNPSKAGDCFLCSSYAIIKHFCQQKDVTPPSMADVYHKVWCEEDIKANTGSNHWATQKFWDYLYHALDWDELKFDRVDDPPLHIPGWHEMATFGPKFFSNESFQNRIQTYLEAGYLIHAQIQAKPLSEYIKEEKRSHGGDHLVVIDGFRITEDQKLTCFDGKVSWYGSIHYYVHVVDSSRKKPKPYWIDLGTWIEEHGGFNMYFIRPTVEEYFGFPSKPEECPEHAPTNSL